jgi:phage gpG-like protein
MAPPPRNPGSSFTGSRSGVQFLEIDFDPEPIILAAAFEKWGMDIRSFREPLEKSVRQVLSPSLSKNFEVGGRPTWTPLSDITIKEKARRGYGNAERPLIRTGSLSKQVGYYNLWVINGPAGEAYISPGKMEGVFYGVYHNFGMTSGGADEVGYPQREWAIIQTEDADNIEEIFFDWIEERALKAGVTIG